MADSSRSTHTTYPRNVLTVLRQPKWIILTLLVPIAIVLCLRAAQWQYDRHVDRSIRSDLVSTNSAQEPTPIADVVAPQTALDAGQQFQPVVAAGEFDPDSTVLVRKRVLEGKTGYWVVTSLQTSAGPLQVLRGFVPTAGDAFTSPDIPPPPSGNVVVSGWLEPSQQSPQPAPTDLPPGQVAALDTAVLNGSDGGYVPYLVALAMAPTDPALATGMRTLPVPNPGLGPHLAYSWQWIAFALLIPVGWVILLRRELQTPVSAQPADEQADHQPA
jgi:cytochrome oxidase assembly protein ShyY1